MDKFLFLDIDGVLNTEVFINAFFEICKQVKLKYPEAKALNKIVMRDEFGNLFCPTACNMLEWIVESAGCKIIISSTWRMSGLEKMQKMWQARKLAGEIIGITPIKTGKVRGEEIKEYLEKNPCESYVIIDDDNDMLEEQKNNFVQTDFRYGITFDDAIKAIKILIGQEKFNEKIATKIRACDHTQQNAASPDATVKKKG